MSAEEYTDLRKSAVSDARERARIELALEQAGWTETSLGSGTWRSPDGRELGWLTAWRELVAPSREP